MNSNVVLIATLILLKVLVIGVRHANAHDNSFFYNPPQSHSYDQFIIDDNGRRFDCGNSNLFDCRLNSLSFGAYYELKKNWGGYDLYDNNGNFLKSFNTWSMGW